MHIDDVEIVVTNVDFIMGYSEGWENVPGINKETAAALNEMGEDAVKCESFLNSIGEGYAYRIIGKDPVNKTFNIVREGSETNNFQSGFKVVSVIEKRLLQTLDKVRSKQSPNL